MYDTASTGCGIDGDQSTQQQGGDSNRRAYGKVGNQGVRVAE